jgi:hypothetical protein
LTIKKGERSFVDNQELFLMTWILGGFFRAPLKEISRGRRNAGTVGPRRRWHAGPGEVQTNQAQDEEAEATVPHVYFPELEIQTSYQQKHDS